MIDAERRAELEALRGPIQAALQRRGFWFAFPKPLEAFFEREGEAERRRHMAASSAIGVLVYDLFLYSDYIMVPDVFHVALLIRLAIVTPIVLLCVALVLRWLPPVAREGVTALMITVVAASLAYIAASSRAPLAVHYHYGISLVLLFANVVIQLRFPFAAVSSILVVAIYTVGVALSPGMPPAVRETAMMLAASAALLSLFANWALERNQRKAFLLSLSERLLTLELERRNQRLEELFGRDPLTGVANRRYFDERMRSIWDRALITEACIGVLMVDVDHFKRYNDIYGHQRGDECLRLVAARLRDVGRGTVDCVARYGGEEFVIVLSGATDQRCAAVAEDMRREIAALIMP